MSVISGVPDCTPSFPGIDSMGSGCRVDPTVTVMRFWRAMYLNTCSNRIACCKR